jgi:hypothetical protein
MQEKNPCRKLTLHKQEGTQQEDRPAIGWMDSVEDWMLAIADKSHGIGTSGEES